MHSFIKFITKHPEKILRILEVVTFAIVCVREIVRGKERKNGTRAVINTSSRLLDR